MPDNTRDKTAEEIELVASGIPELDELLKGGYIRGRTYLVQGVSGTGKSLLGQHFLRAGLDADGTVVYIHGEESRLDTESTQALAELSETALSSCLLVGEQCKIQKCSQQSTIDWFHPSADELAGQ